MECSARLTRTCLAVATLALLAPAPVARAADPQVGQTVVKSGPTVASDLYAFGGGVDIQADVEGDLVAAGGRVVTTGRVRGNLIVAAGSVVAGGHVLPTCAQPAAPSRSLGTSRNLNAGGGTVVPDSRGGHRRARAPGRREVRVAGTIAKSCTRRAP